MKTQFTDAEQIEHLKNSMDSFCKRLIVVPLRETCSTFLLTKVDEIVSFFEKIDPEIFCHDVHIC